MALYDISFYSQSLIRPVSFQMFLPNDPREGTDTGNIRIDQHGIVGVVNHKSRLGAGHFAHLFFLHLVHLHLVLGTSLGVVGGQTRGLLERGVGQRASL